MSRLTREDWDEKVDGVKDGVDVDEDLGEPVETIALDGTEDTEDEEEDGELGEEEGQAVDYVGVVGVLNNDREHISIVPYFFSIPRV